jgi:hypothetical protein
MYAATTTTTLRQAFAARGLATRALRVQPFGVTASAQAASPAFSFGVRALR